MNLSIVIPARNEEKNIIGVIAGIESSLKIPHELIVVNDYSTDKTAELTEAAAKEYPDVRLVNNSGERGFAGAIKSGFRQANNELIVPVMADACDDPATLGIMMQKMSEGYDVVCGSRYIQGGSRIGGPKIKGFFSFLAGVSIFRLAGIPTHDPVNTFKMYRKQVVDSIETTTTDFEISMELLLKAHYAGFKIAEVPTVWKERRKGKSNFSLFKLLPKYLKLYLWCIAKNFKLRKNKK